MTGPHDITRGGVYLGSKVTGARCQILVGACLDYRKVIEQPLWYYELAEFIIVVGLSASSTQQFLPA